MITMMMIESTREIPGKMSSSPPLFFFLPRLGTGSTVGLNVPRPAVGSGVGEPQNPGVGATATVGALTGGSVGVARVSEAASQYLGRSGSERRSPETSRSAAAGREREGPRAGRGTAAAATRIFRGRVAAPPRLPRGYAEGAAIESRIVRSDRGANPSEPRDDPRWS